MTKIGRMFELYEQEMYRVAYAVLGDEYLDAGFMAHQSLPAYVGDSSKTGENSPYIREIGAGKTVTLTLGWLIDEDLFDKGAAIVVHGCRHTTIAYYNLVYFDIK